MRIVRRKELIHLAQYLALTFVLVLVHHRCLFGMLSKAFLPTVLSCPINVLFLLQNKYGFLSSTDLLCVFSVVI